MTTEHFNPKQSCDGKNQLSRHLFSASHSIQETQGRILITINHPIVRSLPLLALLLVLIAGIAGIGGLTTNASYRVYFDQSDPAMLEQNSFENEFERRDSLLLIVTPPPADPQQNIYQQPAENFRDFAEQLLALPQINAVRGLNEWFDAFNDTYRDALQQLYIASAAQSGLIELDVELRDNKSALELSELGERIKTLANQTLPDQTGVEFGGPLALNLAYSDVIKHDLRVFIPGLILLTGLMLYLALGHIGLSISLILLGALAVAFASGIAGWLRFEMAAINAFGPVVIVGLSLATQLHLVLACVRQLNNGQAPAKAVTAGIAECRWPFTISCLTTAAGFAALIFSPSPPVQRLGLTVAIGVVTVYLLGLVVLPALLARLHLTPLALRYFRWQQLLQSLAQRLERYKKWVIGFFVLLLVGTLPPLLQLKINDFVYGYFPDEHSFTKSIATLDTDYSGSVQLHYKIDSGREDGIFEKTHLNNTKRWIDWLKQQPEVNSVNNLSEHILKVDVPVARIKQAIDTTAFKRLVNADYSAEAVTVVMKSTTADALLKFDKRVAMELESYPQGKINEGGLGSDLVFAKLGFRNAASMFTTLALALLAISILLGIFFKSLTMFWVGLVCNTLPLVVVYGIWALAGGYISLGSAVVMGMIMGIIVDDTVHMLYRYHFKKCNEPSSPNRFKQGSETRWIKDMLADTGPALLVSSIALIVGLAIGLLSSFQPVKELALLSMAIIFLATVTDLILLPALLNFSRNRSRP